MENKVGFTPVHNGVLVKWNEVEEFAGTGLILPPEIKAQKEYQENGISEIVAVGPTCTVKVGQWALLNGAGRLINVGGKVYGLIKEHQIDGVYHSKPEITRIEATEENASGLPKELTKTKSKLSQISNKYKL